jgi:hypothetical protein
MHDTATDVTIKCASFAIGNQEIRDSKHSSISFKRMYKKMTDLPWLSLNKDGSINKDDQNYDLYDLATTYTFKSTDNTRKHALNF